MESAHRPDPTSLLVGGQEVGAPDSAVIDPEPRSDRNVGEAGGPHGLRLARVAHSPQLRARDVHHGIEDDGSVSGGDLGDLVDVTVVPGATAPAPMSRPKRAMVFASTPA